MVEISVLGYWCIVIMFVVLIYQNFKLRLEVNDLSRVVNNNANVLKYVYDDLYTQEENDDIKDNSTTQD